MDEYTNRFFEEDFGEDTPLVEAVQDGIPNLKSSFVQS